MAVDIRNQMTAKGYIRRSAEEIQESIISKLKEKNPNFEKLPYDVQANLIDTAIAKIAQYENILDVMFNAYSFDGSNQFFFNQMGEELGLRMKNAYNAQVVLRFKGLAGDIIPLHTQVKDASGQYKFETLKRAIIGTTGEVDIQAYGEANMIVPANSLNYLVTILSDGITVTNPEPSMSKIEEETFEEFKFRAQARLRSPRLGGRLYAETCLKAIDGVDPRLVAFYARDYAKEYDPLRPELDPEETDPEEKEFPIEAENSVIMDTIIAKINLVNEGETRPDILTLQDYVDSKYALGVNIQDKEFVHLYNKGNPNNYLYYNGHWYEVKFRRANNPIIINGFGINKNIPAENWGDIPTVGTNNLYFCKSPGEKVAFYENQNSKLTCLFGPKVEIDESKKPTEKNYIRLVGIESVVGGGDEYEVALALYQSFFETQKLMSNPSNEETDRRKKVQLGLYNNTFPIVFTRPKLLELNLKFEIAMLNKSMSALAIKKSTQSYLEKSINALKVGKDVTINQLNQFIMPGLADIDVQPVEIKSMNWKYDIGQFKDAADEDAADDEKAQWKDFDIDNKIPQIFFDCYCVLVRYEVDVIG